MRRALLVLVLVAACGDRREAPRIAAEAAQPAAAAADDAPPAPPFRPLDAARLDELERVAVPGFEVVARDRSATSIVVALRGGALRATVTVTPCLACRPADPAAWRAILPELRALLPGGLEDDPVTAFELDAAIVAGRRCITTWELGAVAYGDEVEATHGARVYCNDGTTELAVRVDDDAVAKAPNPDVARGMASRAVVEEAARRIAGAYLAAM